jgi:hypothetical protein
MATVEIIQAVTERLVASGYDATMEYPGYIAVKVGDLSFAFGDANETWAGDIETADVGGVVVTDVPSDSTNVEKIAVAIELAIEACKEASMKPERTAFGKTRSSCACEVCVRNCRFMPGMLIPEDLDRMLVGVADPIQWAMENLLASPGATALDISTGALLQIRTLVPAVKPDGSCIHLTAENRCEIHADAPFGCAFFDCHTDARDTTSRDGLLECANQFDGPYGLIWQHLWDAGKRQESPSVLRSRMVAEETKSKRVAFTAIISGGSFGIGLAAESEPGYWPQTLYGQFPTFRKAMEKSYELNVALGLTLEEAVAIISSSMAAQNTKEN